jgi:hypothetical protein
MRTRLDGENHARLENRFRARVQAGVFVLFESEAVTRPVKKLLAVARCLDDAPRRGVDFAGRDARTYSCNCGVVCIEDELMNL